VLDTRQMWSAPALRNHWTKFTIHLMNSTDPSVGFVELFGDLDGSGEKLLMPRTSTHTMTIDPQTGAPMINHARVGIYRNPKIVGTAHILFDGFTIGTDRKSVEAAAFEGGSGAGSQPPAVTPPVGTPPAVTPPATSPPATRTPPPPATTSSTPTPPSSSTPTPEPPKPTSTPRKRRSHRVVLRARHRHSRTLARSSGLWPRVVPVYGWVKTGAGSVGRRTVVIQIRHRGRWLSLSRGWLRSNGRFYLAPSIDPSLSHRVKLRAHVAGLGYSKVVVAHV
jgi:hypothetical protein